MHETMKKTLLFTALAAVLALVSCNKEENQALPKVTKTVHFTAAAPETKALFSTPNGNTYPVLWTENDTKVDLLVNYDNNNKLTPELVRSDDNKTATFSADVEAEGDAYTFVAVSPANSVISANNTDKRFGISVPTGQASTAGSPDPKAIMLYAKSDDYKSFQSNVSMDFHHITGYFHLVFTDYAAALDGATVSSVTINADKVLAGRIFFFPGDGHMEENGTSGSGTVTATTSSLDNVWMGVAPVNLSNETMTIVVNTDKGTITKSIQFGANAVLSSGKIAKLQISLAGSTLVAPVQYNLVTDKSQLHIGDKIIIVAANSNVAISSTQNDNNRGQASITKGEGVILDPSDAVEVFELEDGIKPGEFALKATSAEKPGYLYAAYEDANTGNYMRTKDALDKYGSWSISIADKQNGVDDTDKDDYTKYVATIQAESSARGLMLYNQASSLFSSYSTTSSLLKSKVSYLHIYRLDKAADTTPRFKATMPDADGENQVTISASAKDNIEVYVFGNSSWTASVTSGATLSETAGTGNTILTLSVPENTSTTDTQEYTVTISTTASVTPASYVFTITQSKKPGEGGVKVGDVLWSENWKGAAANDTPAVYQKSENATTTVYENAKVSYSIANNDTSSKIYADGLVFLVNNKGTQSPSNYLEDDQINNLLLKKSNGWFKVAGIPCGGVKQAVLTYKSNTTPQGRNITVTTDSENVTLSELTVTNKSYSYTYSDSTTQTKTYYVITCSITFGDDFTGDTFNLQFNNGYSSNIRLTHFEVKVTDIK